MFESPVRSGGRSQIVRLTPVGRRSAMYVPRGRFVFFVMTTCPAHALAFGTGGRARRVRRAQRVPIRTSDSRACASRTNTGRGTACHRILSCEPAPALQSTRAANDLGKPDEPLAAKPRARQRHLRTIASCPNPLSSKNMTRVFCERQFVSGENRSEVPPSSNADALCRLHRFQHVS